MPSRVPMPRNEPPSTTDHIFTHPWSCCLIFGFWTYTALFLMVAGPAAFVPHVSPLAAWVMAGMLLAGGLLVGLAVVWRGSDSAAWTLETVGLMLGAGAWACNSYGEDGPLFAGLGWLFVAGSVLRIGARLYSREQYHRTFDRDRMAGRHKE